MLTGHKAKRFVVENGEKVLIAERAGRRRVRITLRSAALCRRRAAWPTRPATAWRSWASARRHSARWKRTSTCRRVYPNILRLRRRGGTRIQFTHTASHQAWYAAGQRACSGGSGSSAPTTR